MNREQFLETLNARDDQRSSLNPALPVFLPNLDVLVYGGPYTVVTEVLPVDLHYVNMAKELGHLTSDSFVPTQDFSTPDPKDLRRALMQSIARAYQGTDIAVGCMGGIGRTGLFMAAMVKISVEAGFTTENPIQYVRNNYNSHAVETHQQEKYIRDLNVSDIAKWVKTIQ